MYTNCTICFQIKTFYDTYHFSLRNNHSRETTLINVINNMMHMINTGLLLHHHLKLEFLVFSLFFERNKLIARLVWLEKLYTFNIFFTFKVSLMV